jgi:UDP-N-acetylmuramoylalanine--D-glutamate ligase
METKHIQYDRRCALVLGAGVSGVCAAQLLRARGGTVVVLDEAPAARLAAVAAELAATGVALRADGGPLPETPFDLCVTSPGIAMNHPWLDACRARQIPVIAETELGFAYWPGRILAVTGSKGKSSLVKLCADTLTLAGVPAAPAGNYGTPLSRLAMQALDAARTAAPAPAWAVVEVSSFQIEHLQAFRPDVAILLNVQADHLDRHATVEEYRVLKLRLFARQQAGDVALIPEGLAADGAVPPAALRLTFGAGASCEWRYEPHRIVGPAGAGAAARTINLTGSWFDNPVLGLAAAAGTGALAACGLTDEAIARGLAAFEPLAHRMQLVGERGGVRFVDDSKATSLAAVAAALQMTAGPVRLIAGGRLKEHDLDGLKELLTSRVRKVYLIGECARRMFSAWSGALPCTECGTLDVAVADAAREAMPGETVLLSPGCASFDQFGNYRERGERFTRLVRERDATYGSVVQ